MLFQSKEVLVFWHLKVAQDIEITKIDIIMINVNSCFSIYLIKPKVCTSNMKAMPSKNITFKLSKSMLNSKQALKYPPSTGIFSFKKKKKKARLFHHHL